MNSDQNNSPRKIIIPATAAAVLPVERAVHGAPSYALKLALVGCGGRGSGAAVQALNTSNSVHLVAMGEVSQSQLDKSLKNIKAQKGEQVDVPKERQFVGFDAYRKTIAECDVVILATSPGFRPLMFEEAVRQGKHVFMEKPVAVDAPGVRKILKAAKIAKEKNLKTAVGMQRRHQPVYEELAKRIQDGAIGDLHTLRVYWLGNSRDGKERLPDESEMTYQIRNWYYFTWLSGDHIVEQHIHNIDVGNWLKQAYPVRANGQGGRQVRNGKRHCQIFDHHYVEYEYADGSRMISQCRQIRGCFPEVAEYAHGTKGSASIPPGQKLFAITGPKAWSQRLKRREDGHQLEHYPFFNAIQENKPYHEAEYGAKSTMVAIMGRMATYSGKSVTWDQAFNSKLTEMPEELGYDVLPKVLPDKDGWYPVAQPGSTKSW
jgi:myo-inositol 2-dehydrogenase / D-chiro-inositol 1-dehydrogenase